MNGKPKPLRNHDELTTPNNLSDKLIAVSQVQRGKNLHYNCLTWIHRLQWEYEGIAFT